MSTKTYDIQPLGDNVLIEEHKPQQQTEGGIHLPDSYEQHPMTGTVVAVGPGLMLEDGTRATMTVQVGDRIMLPLTCPGTQYNVDGKEMVMLSEQSIMGICRGDHKVTMIPKKQKAKTPAGRR